MGIHGHEPYTVPHPSIYKIENVPQLKEVQEALARQGLKDPWLRNEAWRYEPKQFGTHGSRARAFFGRGFVTGLSLFAVTVAAEFAIKAAGGGGGGHDNHDEHGKH